MAEKARRVYGEGSIEAYDTKAGERFLIRYRAYDPAQGKVRPFKQRGFEGRRAASKALREKLQSNDDRSFVAPTRQTLADYIESKYLPWIRTQVRPNTANTYERILRRHVLAYPLGGLPMQEIESDTLEAHYGVLTAKPTVRKYRGGKEKPGPPISAHTIVHVHVALHAVFNYALKHNRVRFNPAQLARPPVFDVPKPKVWSVQQLVKFLDHEPTHKDHDFWVFIADTGMRRGEALGLSWDDIDLDAGTVSVRRSLVTDDSDAKVLRWSPPKTKAGFRVVDLGPQCIATLRARRTRAREQRLLLGAGWPTIVDHEGVIVDLVFYNEDGTPRHPKRMSCNFDRAVARAVKALGIPRISIHGLRHTWATMALKAGVDAKIVQERLGHTRVSTTQEIYQHVMPGMQSEAASQVAELLDLARIALEVGEEAKVARLLARYEEGCRSLQQQPDDSRGAKYEAALAARNAAGS